MGLPGNTASSLGKIDNCQVGVFAAYASPHGYALLDKRLFIPERWFSDEFSGKREKCEVPDSISFRTKPQLAVEMLEQIAQEDILPFKYVVADSVYGNSPDFVNAAQKMIGVTYFVSINSQTLCWLRPPSVGKKGFKIVRRRDPPQASTSGEKGPYQSLRFRQVS